MPREEVPRTLSELSDSKPRYARNNELDVEVLPRQDLNKIVICKLCDATGNQNHAVVAGVTDCEPSVVKAGRNLADSGVFKHVGCTNHRP